MLRFLFFNLILCILIHASIEFKCKNLFGVRYKVILQNGGGQKLFNEDGKLIGHIHKVQENVEEIMNKNAILLKLTNLEGKQENLTIFARDSEALFEILSAYLRADTAELGLRFLPEEIENEFENKRISKKLLFRWLDDPLRFEYFFKMGISHRSFYKVLEAIGENKDNMNYPELSAKRFEASANLLFRHWHDQQEEEYKEKAKSLLVTAKGNFQAKTDERLNLLEEQYKKERSTEIVRYKSRQKEIIETMRKLIYLVLEHRMKEKMVSNLKSLEAQDRSLIELQKENPDNFTHVEYQKIGHCYKCYKNHIQMTGAKQDRMIEDSFENFASTCVICMEKNVNFDGKLQECGHQHQIHDDCAKPLDKCPICRGPWYPEGIKDISEQNIEEGSWSKALTMLTLQWIYSLTTKHMKYMTELSPQDLEHHLTDALVPGILATTKSNELQEFYREILGDEMFQNAKDIMQNNVVFQPMPQQFQALDAQQNME